MLIAFLTTLVVVTVLLVALFRSALWAVLAMVPILWTVLVTYGFIGWVGRDYDMPVGGKLRPPTGTESELSPLPPPQRHL